MKEIQFNINDIVKVKLTEEGKDILAKAYGGNIPEFFYKQYVDDGWWEFQLWDLMQTFGSHLYNGQNKLPFLPGDFKFIVKED